MGARVEHVRRRLPALEHRLPARLSTEASPPALGAKNLTTVLATRLVLSTREATRRLRDAADLGPRHTLTGDALEPVLPVAAAAQAAGHLGTEHITILRQFFHTLPRRHRHQHPRPRRNPTGHPRHHRHDPRLATHSRRQDRRAPRPRRRPARRPRPRPPPLPAPRPPTRRRHERHPRPTRPPRPRRTHQPRQHQPHQRR
ncbi:MAG: DUF222 domain-containing protein [Actinobacteria bacterium]|nr:DUF222 domain-containing protein [Actinomycetota bacterium]